MKDNKPINNNVVPDAAEGSSSFSPSEVSTKHEVSPHQDGHYDIPPSYGDNKIVLMVRDPWTMYTYWEIRDDVEKSVRDKIEGKGLTPEKSILRVYSVTDTGAGEELNINADFELRGWINNWYIHEEETGRDWVVEIGILCTNGEFFCLARSNAVHTPVNCMSMVGDEDWMDMSRMFDSGDSFLNFKERIDRYLRKWLFSGSVSSGMSSSSDPSVNRK